MASRKSEQMNCHFRKRKKQKSVDPDLGRATGSLLADVVGACAADD
jgi:hypothetical protein